MEKLEENWIMLDEKLIYYYIKRKKIKNMYMRFTMDGKLVISTSITCSLERIENFIKLKKSWIIKQQELQEKELDNREKEYLVDNCNLYFFGKKYKSKIFSGKVNSVELDGKNIILTVKEKYVNNLEYVKNIYEKWLKEECLKITMKYIEMYCEKMKKYGIPFPDVKIKKFKSRWGCCTPKKNKIEFAMNLVKVPNECIEYVVVHELAHFKYIHHDMNFYNFVSIFVPDWKKKREILNKEYSRIVI